MKLSKLYKFLGTGLLAVSLAIPFTTTVQAQLEPEPEIEVVEEDDGFDWGWLGLLGLIGLAGLSGRKRQDVREYRTETFPETPTRR